MKKNTHATRRSQGRSGSTGKSSAKKSASASGDSGGGGDGDGDGPKRNKNKKTVRPKSAKKTVRPKSATPSPKYPPSPTTGAHQVSPPQSPSAPASNRGQETALKGLAVYLFFIIVLVLLGEIELARSFVDSKWIPLVLVSMTKLPKIKK